MFRASIYITQKPEHLENLSTSLWRASKYGAGGEKERERESSSMYICVEKSSGLVIF